MLKKIFFKNQNKVQLIIAMLGTLLGFTFLITSVHYLIRIQDYGEKQEILGNDSFILQKKISNFSSLHLSSIHFEERELKELKKQSFIRELKPVRNNNFDISIQTASDLVPYFRSAIFVQSVGGDFLAIDSNIWNWSPQSQYVPIILPREFLIMLNTFANAKGLPQVSEDLAKSIDFKFAIYNKNKKEERKVKIVGFTGKISSILVPPSFIAYGNSHYPTSSTSEVTQLMVRVQEGNFGKVEDFMNKHNLVAKESSMTIGKLKSIGNTLFSVLIGIGVITIFLAGLVMIQYSQLIISKNKYEIRTLLRQGYAYRQLTKIILTYFIRIFVLIFGGSILCFVILKYFIDQLLHKSGLFLAEGFTIGSFLTLLIALLVFILANKWNVKGEILSSEVEGG